MASHAVCLQMHVCVWAVVRTLASFPAACPLPPASPSAIPPVPLAPEVGMLFSRIQAPPLLIASASAAASSGMMSVVPVQCSVT